MDFKSFYTAKEKQEQEDLMLEKFGEGIKAIGDIAAKGVGLADKAIGGAIKKGVEAVVKVATGGRNFEYYKAKFNNALDLAEKVYPQDKKTYDLLRKTGEKGNIVSQYLSFMTTKNLPYFAGYSAGLDIVFRAYQAAEKGLGELLEKKEGGPGKNKMSFRSLDESRRYRKIGNITFPKVKTKADVDALFKQDSVADTNSMLYKWVDVAAHFSSWKNKYNNHDDEQMPTSIITEILDSGLLNVFPIEAVEEKMHDLEKAGEQVNLENIASTFSAADPVLIKAIRNGYKEVALSMGIDPTSDSFFATGKKGIDDLEISQFVLNRKQNKNLAYVTNTDLLTKMFVGFTYVTRNHTDLKRDYPVANALKQSIFSDIFKKEVLVDVQKIRGVQRSDAKVGITPTEQATLFSNFIAFLNGTFKDVKPTIDILSSKQKIYDVIKPDFSLASDETEAQ